MTLHIYGQVETDDDVVIVGDRQGLQALIGVLRAAITARPETVTASGRTRDGGEYLIRVAMLAPDSPDWARALPPVLARSVARAARRLLQWVPVETLTPDEMADIE